MRSDVTRQHCHHKNHHHEQHPDKYPKKITKDLCAIFKGGRGDVTRQLDTAPDHTGHQGDALALPDHYGYAHDDDDHYGYHDYDDDEEEEEEVGGSTRWDQFP